MILAGFLVKRAKRILRNLPFFRFLKLFLGFLRKVAGILRFFSINEDGENGVLWVFGVETGIF